MVLARKCPNFFQFAKIKTTNTSGWASVRNVSIAVLLLIQSACGQFKIIGPAFSATPAASSIPAPLSSAPPTSAPPNTTSSSDSVAPDHPRLFLTPKLLASLQLSASNQSPEWISLKSECDKMLSGSSRVYLPSEDAYPNSPNLGAGYQGESYVPAIHSLGLCYQVALKTQPQAAAIYGSKALQVFQALITLPDGSAGLSASTDSGYGIRNYATAIAVGYDWLYPLLTDSLKSKAISAFNQWIDFYDEKGGSRAEGTGNYFEGYLAGKVLGTLATSGDNSKAVAYWNDINQRMWLVLTKPALLGYLKGGGWPEGFQYGPLAIRNIAEVLWAAKTARGLNWISEVSFVRDQASYLNYFSWPSLLHMDDGGGLIRSQAALRVSTFSSALLATVLEQIGDSYAPVARSFTDKLIAISPADDRPSWARFKLASSTTVRADYRTQPLSYQVPGSGQLAMRSNWESNATMGVLSAGPYGTSGWSGEQYYNAGNIEIVKGDFPVIATPAGWLPQGDNAQGEEFIYANNYGQTHARDAYNIFFVDDSTNPSNPGQSMIYAPTARTHLSVYEEGGGYVHTRAINMEDMYSGKPIDQFTRDLVFVRPDIFVIYDRTSVAARNVSADQWENFHFAVSTLSVAASDSSQARYDLKNANGVLGSFHSLLPANTLIKPGARMPGDRVWGIELHAPVHQKNQEWLNVVGTSEQAPDLSRLTVSDGSVAGSMTGVHVHQTNQSEVVLFSNDQIAAGKTTSVSYTISQPGPTDHFLIDMANSPSGYALTTSMAGSKLTVSVKPGGTYRATASGTLSFKTNADGTVLP